MHCILHPGTERVVQQSVDPFSRVVCALLVIFSHFLSTLIELLVGIVRTPGREYGVYLGLLNIACMVWCLFLQVVLPPVRHRGCE